MKCVIPSLNIKVFGKSIQSLAKISNEISLEFTQDGLHLKAINSTRSCLAVYKFKPRFFQHFDSGFLTVDESNPRYRLTSKVGIQNMLSVFRSLNGIEKLVEKCIISINDNLNRVVFSLSCRHGIVKTYSLTYMESEDALNCSLSHKSCPSFIKAESKLFMEIFSSFPSSLEETTMIVTPQSISLRNFVDDAVKDPLKTLSTVMTLHQDEFETYQVNTDTSVSFCLKDLKVALTFAEYANLNISIHFDTGGKPMFILMDTDPNYEATFITSTIMENLSQESTSTAASDARKTAAKTSNMSHAEGSSGDASRHAREADKKTSSYSRGLQVSGKSSRIANLGRTSSEAVGSHRNSKKHNESEHSLKVIDTSTSSVEAKPRISALLNDSSITLLPAEKTHHEAKNDVDLLLEEIDRSRLPTVSSTKTAKSIFFNKTPVKQDLRLHEEVLAADSEDED